MSRAMAALSAVLGTLLLGSTGLQASGAVPPGSPAAAPTAPVAAGVDATIAALEKRGFEVAEGGFTMWGVEDCPSSYALMGTCYFNNPTAPYNLAVVPHWPEEYVDPATADALGASPEGSGSVFRLDPNEAILVFGHLPPEASYFGIQSYVFSREGHFRTDNPAYTFLDALGATGIFFHQIPGNTDRVATFDSISDSTNNVVIERQSGSSWNQLRYFVISPDRYLDKQVRQVLHRLSVADKDVFSEAIPSNLVLGLDADADELAILLRYARPADGGGPESASWRWRADPDLRLLRIRDTRVRPAQLHPAWTPDSPETRGGVSESYLADDLAALTTAVSVAWGQPCAGGDCVAAGRAARFIDTQSPPINLVGPKCLGIGMDCVGDTQDATYQFLPGLQFDDGQVYAVAGTLGTATGNATYVSLGVNNTRLRLGAINVDGAVLEGSAAPYGVGHADELYVHFFTRDCSDLGDLTRGQCTEVGASALEIPPGVRASLVERDYIAVGTRRGPDSTLSLPSVVLRLQRPVVG